LIKSELVLDEKALIGESPIWDEKTGLLYWVDIPSRCLYVYDPSNGSNRRFNVGQQVGTVVCREKGGLLLALEHGFYFFDTITEKLTFINDPEKNLDGNRFNDGKCDPKGRFWAGTMNNKKIIGNANLYVLDEKQKVNKVLDGITISNGIVWSPDNTRMYFIDSITSRVDAFNYDNESGNIWGRRTVVEFCDDALTPDGMTIDEDGMIWVALWGGSSVRRFDPNNGELLETVTVDASQVTACAFGGPSMDELYITTARVDLSPEELLKEPFAGGLFRAKISVVKGLKSYKYIG